MGGCLNEIIIIEDTEEANAVEEQIIDDLIIYSYAIYISTIYYIHMYTQCKGSMHFLNVSSFFFVLEGLGYDKTLLLAPRDDFWGLRIYCCL